MKYNILYHFLREIDIIVALSNKLCDNPLVSTIKGTDIKFGQIKFVLMDSKKFIGQAYISAYKKALEAEDGKLFNFLQNNFKLIIDSYRELLESYYKKAVGVDCEFVYFNKDNVDIDNHFWTLIKKASKKNNVYVIHDSVYESTTDTLLYISEYSANIKVIINKNKNIKIGNELHEGFKCLTGFDNTQHTKRNTAHLSTSKDKNNAYYNFDDIITVNSDMIDLINYAKFISTFNEDVLILGDTGTGKEMFAQAIHSASKRHREPFISVNCAAIPENLFESEMFGIGKGVATNVLPRTGKMVVAKAGTLFLDEIGDLSLLNQTRLLRALQEKKITKVGSDKEIKINCRIICATNRFADVDEFKNFRNDLYYRINKIQLVLPTLKERGENDVHFLLSTFLEEEKLKHPEYIDINIMPQVLKYLYKYSWPGNIRELKTFVSRSLSIAAFLKKNINSFIRSACLDLDIKIPILESTPPPEIEKSKATGQIETNSQSDDPYSKLFKVSLFDGFNLDKLFDIIEKEYIKEAYKQTKKWDKAQLLIGYSQSKMIRRKGHFKL